MARRIEGILIDRLLKGKRWLDYLPAERGRRYRVFRATVVRHPYLFGLAAALAIGAVARWVMPLVVPGFWDAISAGRLGHLVNFGAGIIVCARAVRWIDEQLYFDPHRFALAKFNRLAFPWLDAYDSIRVESRGELDEHVITARHARDIPDELTYGILVAKVADILADLKSDGGMRGIDTAAYIEMMMAQKLDRPGDQELMERLFAAGVSPEALANVVQGVALQGLAGDPVVRGMLGFWLEHGAFQLRVDVSWPISHVGSQLSRGFLDLRGNLGQNCLSYMGKHSRGEDFPIVQIVGGAGDSLATSAARGLVHVSGDVGSDCGKGMTGGTIVVGGRPGNRFGNGMDDRTHPAVLVAYRAIDGYLPEDSIANGLVLLLNLDVPGGPRLARFRNGQKEELEPTLDADRLYALISEYARGWRAERGLPMASVAAGEAAR